MGCSPSTPSSETAPDDGDDTHDDHRAQDGGGKSSLKLKFSSPEEDNIQPCYSGSGLPITFRTPSNTNIVLNASSSSTPFVRMIDQQRYFDKPEPGCRGVGNLVRLGPMSIFRSTPIRLSLIFPKEDSLHNGILAGCDRLAWEPGVRLTSIPDQLSYLGHDPFGINLLLLDYRQPKLLPLNILPVIRSLKDENSTLVVVAFVKKNSLDKCESVICNLQDYGVDWVETDCGLTSSNHWHHQLAQYERCFLLPALKLGSAKTLLVALDQCRDMIQITDSSHRIQFVNRAYERLMGYSCEEITGCDFHELQTRGGGGHHNSLTMEPDVQGRNDANSPTTLNTGGRVSPAGAAVATTSQQGQHHGHPLPPPFHDHLLQEISHGKEWEGNYMYNPKAGDPIFLNSKVLPFNVNLNLNPSVNPTGNANYASSSPTSDILAGMTKCKLGSTHYIYVSDVPSVYAEKGASSEVGSNQDVGYPMPRGSLKSLRKASYDIKSISNDSSNPHPGGAASSNMHNSGCGPSSSSSAPCSNPNHRSSLADIMDKGSILRRQSLAKLHSLTIEAPITKVINIIAAAQQNCPLYIAQALEKVLEILRTTELYSPQFFEGGSKIKSDDPLTTDLLGALLSQGPRLSTTGRRSSNENTASRLAPRPSLPDIAEAPTSLQKLLETEERWSFDVILLEEITEKRPLVWLGMTIFARFGVAQVLQTDEATLRNWLTLIEANYHTTNSYHNSTHAADVMQATAYFLSTERLKGFLEPLDEVIALIAAVVHDVDHPGKTSPYLINSQQDLALLYNDLSVLESHHAAFTFKLTLSDARVNIFANLEPDLFKIVRQSLIDMVLATEMNKHFEHLSKFVNVFTKPFLREDNQCGGQSDHTPLTPTEPDISTLITPENVVLIKRMLIKCADVGNPTRPLKQCVEWSKRIAEEYFRQTEEELARGLPPVMPMFDRASCSIPKSQTGFVDYFVADMYEAWDAFIDVPEVIEHMKYNYDYWKEQDKLGLRDATLNETYLQKYPQPVSRFVSLRSLEQSQL
ncbi:high affinity cAMP-specific and IBMX-insensitive 3',5'-cyclic phosphodiesterase 8A isoform X2 [Folsomia candida]|uniref:high affinity cAMP-specific and IBMX-insensitive 3',5'-cyclic phosphodiesterase 8A isoform X2 n=1 Tax=Folsomia candida TaxID=158441 RepID=UPI000B902D69|nr:high affinity cAMP-specific and IBMX-insensitive 3',5'-cyclic phosphodiesterase 8A isoform X2 [Folsomia candida]